MDESQIKHNFSTNLVKLRNSRGWSQSDLGDAINYSFKNISKWENEETIPSVSVMQEIADCFNVTIDDLIGDKNIVRISHRKQNNIIITILSTLLPFAIALILFFILQVQSVPNAFYSFIGGGIASSIVLITLSALWFRKWVLCGGVIYLLWMISLLVIFLLNFVYFWIVLIIAAVLSALTFGLFRIYFTHHIEKN